MTLLNELCIVCEIQSALEPNTYCNYFTTMNHSQPHYLALGRLSVVLALVVPKQIVLVMSYFT